jgi:predicted RNase H-like HicB family nuclease
MDRRWPVRSLRRKPAFSHARFIATFKIMIIMIKLTARHSGAKGQAEDPAQHDELGVEAPRKARGVQVKCRMLHMSGVRPLLCGGRGGTSTLPTARLAYVLRLALANSLGSRRLLSAGTHDTRLMRDVEQEVAQFLALPYTVEIAHDPDDDSYFAIVVELEGCMTHADSSEVLWKRIEEAMRDWLSVAIEFNDPIPLPALESHTSHGLRIPWMHPSREGIGRLLRSAT